MLVAPFAPLARGSLRNLRLSPPQSCWTERMSHRYTPSILPLTMHGYACPAPVHERYTLIAAKNPDRYTADIRPTVRLDACGSVHPRPMHTRIREPSPISRPWNTGSGAALGLSVGLSAITTGLSTTRNRHPSADLVVTTQGGDVFMPADQLLPGSIPSGKRSRPLPNCMISPPPSSSAPRFSTPPAAAPMPGMTRPRPRSRR